MNKIAVVFHLFRFHLSFEKSSSVYLTITLFSIFIFLFQHHYSIT